MLYFGQQKFENYKHKNRVRESIFHCIHKGLLNVVEHMLKNIRIISLHVML